MATVPNFISPEEYLRLERASAEKHEYADGQIFAMAGANRAHRKITNNLLTFLVNAVAGSECEADSSEARLFIPATGRYTYADVILTCGKQEYQDDQLDTLLNPNLIVEVLSPSTEAYDRGAKFRAYQSIQSFVEYILISQDVALIEQFTRNHDVDATWKYRAYASLSDNLELSGKGLVVPLTLIYQGVELDTKLANV